MRIALVVDHPQRDLPGLVLLAGRLCQEGAILGCDPEFLRRRVEIERRGDSFSRLPPLKPEDRLPGYEAFREWVEAEGMAAHSYFGYDWARTAWIVSRPHESVQGRRGGGERPS
ncbi:MAG: hypothetical protein ACLF0P_00085 [Thermoanaerobaculia bacterium]